MRIRFPDYLLVLISFVWVLPVQGLDVTDRYAIGEDEYVSHVEILEPDSIQESQLRELHRFYIDQFKLLEASRQSFRAWNRSTTPMKFFSPATDLNNYIYAEQVGLDRQCRSMGLELESEYFVSLMRLFPGRSPEISRLHRARRQRRLMTRKPVKGIIPAMSNLDLFTLVARVANEAESSVSTTCRELLLRYEETLGDLLVRLDACDLRANEDIMSAVEIARTHVPDGKSRPRDVEDVTSMLLRPHRLRCAVRELNLKTYETLVTVMPPEVFDGMHYAIRRSRYSHLFGKGTIDLVPRIRELMASGRLSEDDTFAFIDFLRRYDELLQEAEQSLEPSYEAMIDPPYLEGMIRESYRRLIQIGFGREASRSFDNTTIFRNRLATWQERINTLNQEGLKLLEASQGAGHE